MLMRISVFCFVVIVYLFTPVVHAQTLTGVVTKVSDGDTVSLLLTKYDIELRIRLAGIDAPEGKQQFGMESTANLIALAKGREAEAQCFDKDRYGRGICVLLVDGLDVARAQLIGGYAWVYTKYVGNLPMAIQDDYIVLELIAQELQSGLWAGENPVPPWDYRKAKKDRQ